MLYETPVIEEDKPCLAGAETALSEVPDGSPNIPTDGSGEEVEEADDDYNKDVWDEGGRSDCGYPDGVHDTIMSIGEKVYELLGEPSETIQKRMKGIGSFFQEAAYAVRDIKRGKLNIKEGDAAVVGVDSAEEPEQRQDDIMGNDAESKDERTEVDVTSP